MRHFLACLSKDAEGEETIVNIEINGEKVIFIYLFLLVLKVKNKYSCSLFKSKKWK